QLAQHRIHVLRSKTVDCLVTVGDRSIAHDLVGEPEDEFDGVRATPAHDIDQLFADGHVVVTRDASLGNDERGVRISDGLMTHLNLLSQCVLIPANGPARRSWRAAAARLAPCPSMTVGPAA